MFFISGVQRSGTTLLQSFLEGHPDVLMAQKATAFRIITCFKNQYLLLPHNPALKREKFHQWLVETDKEPLKEIMDTENISSYHSARDFLQGSIQKQLTTKGKKIWGDKAPNLQHFMSDVMLVCPQAKVIHMIRDGRANAASMSARSYKNLRLSAQAWLDGNTFGITNQDILGRENHMLVRYEDLLLEPRKILSSVCEFLGLEFKEEMLRLGTDESQDNYVKNTIDTSKIDAWKTKLKSSEIRQIETIQGGMLQRLGYDLQELSPNVKSKPLGVFQKIRLTQWDNFRQLFRSKAKGMKNKKLVDIKRPLSLRIKEFVTVFVRDVFKLEIFRSLFSKYYYQDKYYKDK